MACRMWTSHAHAARPAPLRVTTTRARALGPRSRALKRLPAYCLQELVRLSRGASTLQRPRVPRGAPCGPCMARGC